MPRHKRKKQPNVWRQDRTGSATERFELPPRHNELFIKYYQGQKFVPDGEWDSYYQTLQEDLPVTFRITGSRRQATQLLKVLKEQFLNNLTNLTVNEKALPPPKCLSWYPDELAWHIDTTKKAVRHNTLLKKLHDFLIAETESGNITRQEAVSMIPPLLLDVLPHHKILDMCAAPGSKTAQLIEYLHADENNPIPDGFVVANDVDNKRCYMMVHQVKRLGSPNCMVVNENAYNFPKLRSSKEGEKLEFYLFDRVLADVPCSGDGTMRKNPDVWAKWKPIMGHNLHGLQIKILKRGLELLNVGGRLVYSTCSFNPVEDEAVIAEMLRKSEGSIEILDMSKQLPGLQFVPGLQTWRLMDKSGNWYESMGDLPSHLVHQFATTMFPPTTEENQQFNLNRCLRVLPHHQNTGGFFICAIHKIKHLPWMRVAKSDTEEPGEVKNTEELDAATTLTNLDSAMKSENVDAIVNLEKVDAKVTLQNVDAAVNSENVDGTKETTPSETAVSTTLETGAAGDSADVDVKTEDGSTEIAVKRKADPQDKQFLQQKQKRFKGYKEDPFLFVEPDDPIWPPIFEYYQIPESFPREQVLYRSQQGNKKTLYFVSSALKNVVECNCERVRFINMGVKFLSRSASPLVTDCDFRITQESLAILGSIYETRTVDITKSDVEIILSQESPYTFKFSDSVCKNLTALRPGSVVLKYKPSKSDPHPDCELLFCGWRGNACTRSFVPKYDRQHFLHLFNMNLDDLRAKLDDGSTEKSETKALENNSKVDNIVGGDKLENLQLEKIEENSKELKSEKNEHENSEKNEHENSEKSEHEKSEKLRTVGVDEKCVEKMETEDIPDLRTSEIENGKEQCPQNSSEIVDKGK